MVLEPVPKPPLDFLDMTRIISNKSKMLNVGTAVRIRNNGLRRPVEFCVEVLNPQLPFLSVKVFALLGLSYAPKHRSHVSLDSFLVVDKALCTILIVFFFDLVAHFLTQYCLDY